MSRLKKAPPKRPYHHGDLRAALLTQVRRIVGEQGVSVVSLREVARRARVSHSAPAHHFRNKAGLLTAFAVEGYDRLADMTQGAFDAIGPADPPDALAAMGRAYVRFAIDNPEHFTIMFPGELLNRQDPEYVRATNRAYGPMVETVTRAAHGGFLTADPILVGLAAWSLAHGLASLWLSRRIQERTGVLDADALAADVTRLFVDGVMRGRR